MEYRFTGSGSPEAKLEWESATLAREVIPCASLFTKAYRWVDVRFFDPPEQNTSGASDNNRLANTKERDRSISLDNHGMRYYDPEVGRYLTPDPIGYAGGVNLYVYVGNNPVNQIDALGLQSEYRWHHMLPEALFRAVKGIEYGAAEFGRVFPRACHKGYSAIQRAYSAAWSGWLKEQAAEGGKLTVESVRGHMTKLAGQKRFAEWLSKGRPAVQSYGRWRKLSPEEKRGAWEAAKTAVDPLKQTIRGALGRARGAGSAAKETARQGARKGRLLGEQFLQKGRQGVEALKRHKEEARAALAAGGGGLSALMKMKAGHALLAAPGTTVALAAGTAAVSTGVGYVAGKAPVFGLWGERNVHGVIGLGMYKGYRGVSVGASWVYEETWGSWTR